MALIDDILELKSRCRVSEEIGHDFGLSEKEIICISSVGIAGSIHSKTLSEEIGLSASRGSRVINALVERGFLEMDIDRSDRRYMNVRLSERGAGCLERMERRKRECEQRMLAGLSEQQCATVRDGINLLLEVI